MSAKRRSKLTVKPSVPAVLERFRFYHESRLAWGSLHIVLDDLNVTDEDVEHAQQWAFERNDVEGYELAGILRAMSRTQRLKLANTA